jgi:hypothetical protein
MRDFNRALERERQAAQILAGRQSDLLLSSKPATISQKPEVMITGQDHTYWQRLNRGWIPSGAATSRCP